MGIRFDARQNKIITDGTSVDFDQPLTTTASTTSAAGLNIAEGAAPTVPVDGDVWVTAAGAFNARLNGATVDLSATGGSGTVTSVSVVSTNGLAGTVATSTTTPAITLSTTITGLLKGNATAISAATAGTDYSAGTNALATGILKSTTTTGALTIAIAGDFPTLNQNTTGTAAGLSATLVATSGGTAQSTYATGDILYASAANTLSKLAAGTNTHVLTLAAGVPTWAAPTGGTGTVTSSGTPLNNEVAVFTSGTDIDSDSTFTWDGTILTANSIATTATNALSIASTQPRISMEETGLGADLGAWIWNANGGDIALSTATDATPFTPVTDAMKFTRGATTAVTGVAFEGTVTATTFSGSGASLTSLVAANISSGNLGSGVVPYITASGANTNFQIAFANTAAFASGNFGLLIDNTTAGFTYNPTNNSMDINGTQYETGGVFPSGSYLIKGTGGGNTFIDCNAGSSVDLYYNGILSVRAGGTGVGTLDIVDGDTAGDASSKQIFFRDSALAQKALITSSTDFTIANNVNGGLVVITAEDSVGTARTILSGDPDGQTILRADNGLSLQVAAGEVAILGDSNGSVWLYNDNVTAFRTVLQTATDQISGAEVRDAEGNFKPVGIGVVINDATTFDTVATHTPFQQANATQTVYFVGAGAGTANFDTYTNVEASQTNIPAGTMWYVQNNAATTVCLIRGGASVTIRYWAGTGAPADVDVTVARGGVATIRKVSDSIYDVWGVGLS